MRRWASGVAALLFSIGLAQAVPNDAVDAPRINGRNLNLARDGDNASGALGATEASNVEMKAIYQADQSVRTGKPHTQAERAKIFDDDLLRRKRTRELLDSGTLHTGEDFEYAATVFQHGDRPDDYLLAHVLATLAVAKGRHKAVWLSAATLDRYLQHSGQQQIFGTQGALDVSGRPNPTLVPDAVRLQFGGLTNADWDAAFTAWLEQRKARQTAPQNASPAPR